LGPGRGTLRFASFLLFSASIARADFPLPPPQEAEELFGRGAELLDRGEAAAASEQFQRLQLLYPLPAWDIRVRFLQGRRALDQRAPVVAAEIFSCLRADAIGLEAYREFFLGQAYEREKKREAALAAYGRAGSLPGEFADLAQDALAFVRLAETKAELARGLAILERASESASPDDLVLLLAERTRISERLSSPSAFVRVGWDLLFACLPPRLEKKLPSALRAQAARLEASLSDSVRLTLAEKRFAAGDSEGAAGVAARVGDKRLSPEDRRRLALLRAAALARLGHRSASDRAASLVPRDGSPEDFRARLLVAENETLRQRTGRRRRSESSAADFSEEAARRLLPLYAPLASPDSPTDVRRKALLRCLALSTSLDDRASALAFSRAITREDANSSAGFEMLWRGVWAEVQERQFGAALRDIEELASVYSEISVSRRLEFWKARCLEELGRGPEAADIRARLAAARPRDLYARFSSPGGPSGREVAAVSSLTFETTADLARVDELLRLRLYREARWEAERLPESRGRSLRLAAANFALGDFLASTSLVKSAFPEIGTAREGGVPDPWRRLFYPVDAGGLVESAAREFGLDRGLFLALVRQESAFDPRARSRAGASGLTQLMPSTARRLSRTLLKKRFQRAFLYDPAINVRLGASYLRSLLEEFDGNALLAVAAYNGGPARVRRVLSEHPGLSQAEILESLPALETRDYVRRVFLYAESYRELYPEEKPAG
jgi:soluble lytic murein transglycosylase